MDSALISINKETKLCQYSDANNPLYLVRDSELIEYKPDRMPIAIYQRMDNFSMQEIEMKPGYQLYLFSDGIADQFGGVKGKKLKSKEFKNQILSGSGLEMSKQEAVLSEYVSQWMGEHEQIDDMLLIGLKI